MPMDSGDSRPDILSAMLPCRLRDLRLGESLALSYGRVVDALDLVLPGGSGYTIPVGTGASA